MDKTSGIDSGPLIPQSNHEMISIFSQGEALPDSHVLELRQKAMNNMARLVVGESSGLESVMGVIEGLAEASETTAFDVASHLLLVVRRRKNSQQAVDSIAGFMTETLQRDNGRAKHQRLFTLDDHMAPYETTKTYRMFRSGTSSKPTEPTVSFQRTKAAPKLKRASSNVKDRLIHTVTHGKLNLLFNVVAGKVYWPWRYLQNRIKDTIRPRRTGKTDL